MELDIQDLSLAVLRIPKELKSLMKSPEWQNRIFVGGGYLRSLIAKEDVNDIDVFTLNKDLAKSLALKLAKNPDEDIIHTDNAFTVKGYKFDIQIIYRWVFKTPQSVADSFDFTVCCAIFYFGTTETDSIAQWRSYADDRFYTDLAAKRLTYRSPVRNEDAGGSLLRVLKYYNKGYRIPLDSLGKVIARMVKGINFSIIERFEQNEEEVGKIITGLLREVDPMIDPLHESHLPVITEKDLNK